MTMISIPEHSPVAVEPTMKSSRSIWKWMTLALTLVAMIIVLAKALPFLHVDRVYENAYMGCPYRLLASHHPRIVNDDPFVENGPHGVYPATAIVYYSGSMAAMRWYNFLFSLIMMALFVLFFFQEHPDSGNSPWEATAYGLLMLTIWKIIGLTLIYPIQVTGMMPGFDCFLLGLWLNRRHPYAAMIAFGFAYSFKGQFLAMLPGILLYKLFIEKPRGTWLQSLRWAAISTLLFFVPNILIITPLAWAFGFFGNWGDLKLYAFRPFLILFSEFQYIIPRVMHRIPDEAQAARIRATEYAGFGFVTWSLVFISMSGYLGALGRGFWLRFHERADEARRPQFLYASAGFLYWINYLFFWRFPYWYNTLPVVLGNIFIIPASVAWLRCKVARFRGASWGVAFLCAITLFSAGMFIRALHRTPGWGDRTPGDSLEPYSWMVRR